jgi:hypothetical protein
MKHAHASAWRDCSKQRVQLYASSVQRVSLITGEHSSVASCALAAGSACVAVLVVISHPALRVTLGVFITSFRTHVEDVVCAKHTTERNTESYVHVELIMSMPRLHVEYVR